MDFFSPLFSLCGVICFLGVVEIKLIQGWNTVLEKEDIYGKDTTRYVCLGPLLGLLYKSSCFYLDMVSCYSMGLRETNKFF